MTPGTPVLYSPTDGTGPFLGTFAGVTPARGKGKPGGRIRVQLPGPRLAITTPDRVQPAPAETATGGSR